MTAAYLAPLIEVNLSAIDSSPSTIESLTTETGTNLVPPSPAAHVKVVDIDAISAGIFADAAVDDTLIDAIPVVPPVLETAIASPTNTPFSVIV